MGIQRPPRRTHNGGKDLVVYLLCSDGESCFFWMLVNCESYLLVLVCIFTLVTRVIVMGLVSLWGGTSTVVGVN